MKSLLTPVIFAFLLMCAASLQAQDSIDLGEFGDDQTAGATGAVDSAPDGAIASALNGEGETYAKNLVANAISERFKFLDLGYIMAGDDSKEDGWNAKYNWQYKSGAGGGFSVEGGSASLRDIAFEVDISGTYSYGNADNPEDYSSAKLSFAYLYGEFGSINAITRGKSDEFQDCLTQAQTATSDDEMLALENQCWVAHRIDDIVSDPSNTYVLSLALTAGLEGDQSYKNQLSTYGISGIYSRADFPSLRLNYEKVDAGDDEERGALTDENTYDRFSAELGYRYQLIETKSANTWFYVSYRYFKEVSAPVSIKDANLDEYDFLSASIRFPSKVLGFIETDKINLYVRYTDGQLPFDRNPDQAVHLGFSTDIATLAGLLAD